MKKSKKSGILLLILGISLMAVLWYANGLRKENDELNKALIEMRHTIEKDSHLTADNSRFTENISFNDISMTYIGTNVRFVFSDESLQALALPLKKAPNLRSIEPLTVVEVLDLVYSNDEEWYYVKIGASINVLWNEGNIDESAEHEILEYDVYGRIIKEDGEHCYRSTPGCFDFWVKKSELSFPQAELIQ